MEVATETVRKINKGYKYWKRRNKLFLLLGDTIVYLETWKSNKIG